MNQSQAKFARTYADGIYRKRLAAIAAKHTIPAVTLTDDEKSLALSHRRFSVIPKNTSRSYRTYLFDYVKFHDESPEVVDQVSIDREQAELKATYDALVLELVLGDNAEALKLLKAFEA